MMTECGRGWVTLLPGLGRQWLEELRGWKKKLTRGSSSILKESGTSWNSSRCVIAAVKGESPLVSAGAHWLRQGCYKEMLPRRNWDRNILFSLLCSFAYHARKDWPERTSEQIVTNEYICRWMAILQKHGKNSCPDLPSIKDNPAENIGQAGSQKKWAESGQTWTRWDQTTTTSPNFPLNNAD